MVPPDAPPWRPSLMKLIGMPCAELWRKRRCSSLRCSTQSCGLADEHRNADMYLTAPMPVTLCCFACDEDVCVAK
eukprot:5738172-Prymnesium_polylepis.1